MELKQISLAVISGMNDLLIVPYGIETCQVGKETFVIEHLLIVPYGIETILPMLLSCLYYLLLIVPYGIETWQLEMQNLLTKYF